MPRASSCLDLLSREVYDPVIDPFTGVCYRNPCAAEEAGVRHWQPGCVLARPVYGGSYEVSGPIGGRAEVLWEGISRPHRGGGGGRRRLQTDRPPPPGGRMNDRRIPGDRPPPPVRESGGGQSLVQQPGHTLAEGRGGTIAYQPGDILSKARGGTIAYQPESTLSRAQPAYTASARGTVAPSASLRRGGGYTAAPRSVAPPSASISRPSVSAAAPRTVAARGTLKGLGQDGLVDRTMARLTSPYTLLIGAVFLGTLVVPVGAGIWYGRRTKSVGRGLLAGVGALVGEGVLAAGYGAYRATSRSTEPLPNRAAPTSTSTISFPLYVR